MPGRKKGGGRNKNAKAVRRVRQVSSAAAGTLKAPHSLHEEAHSLHERSHQVRLTAQTLRQAQTEVTSESEARAVLPFTVVGMGASAGGYEAMAEFLNELPADIGMAFIVVQHLDPHHQSRLTALLGKITPLKVLEIRPGLAIEPNCVYVMPSNTSLTLEDGRLRLGPRDPKPAPMPIDTFFRSLANTQQNR